MSLRLGRPTGAENSGRGRRRGGAISFLRKFESVSMQIYSRRHMPSNARRTHATHTRPRRHHARVRVYKVNTTTHSMSADRHTRHTIYSIQYTNHHK